MKMNVTKRLAISFFCGCALLSGAASCVKADYKLGYSLIPEHDILVTRTVSIPIDSILTARLDSLSGYSSLRMVVGGIRDKDLGLTRHGCAVKLAPINDSLVWGTNIRFISMHVDLQKDSIDTAGDESNRHILQNIRVYALEKDTTYLYSSDICCADFIGKTPICVGSPVYDGGDSLGFHLTEEFASTYWKGFEGTVEKADTINYYTKNHPGFFICADDPEGLGGRVNFFTTDVSLDDDYYLTGSLASLSVRFDLGDRKDVDTTYYFSMGGQAPGVYTSFYAFNTCEHESEQIAESGKFGTPVIVNGNKMYYDREKVLIEGGIGFKPVITATHLRSLVARAIADTLANYGYTDVEKALRDTSVMLNRATLVLPYQYVSYEDRNFCPEYLNPTVCVTKRAVDASQRDTLRCASITDSTVEDENQGEIDYSRERFCPDITFHLQDILRKDPSTKAGRDTLGMQKIWLMVLHDETYITKTESDYDEDYYAQLAYMSYYNQLYGGYGYGSYSGYGYNSYDNYYSYYLLQSYYNSLSSSSSSSTEVTTADKDRFYKAWLSGPEAQGEKPRLQLTFSFLRNSLK